LSATDNPLDQIPNLAAAAREVLAMGDGQTQDLRLWERAKRVVRSARAMCAWPEVQAAQPDREAVTAAGLFVNAGWAADVRSGQLAAWQVLGKPTSEAQREIAVEALEAVQSPGLAGAVLERAADAIREGGNRATRVIEARIVSDAETLDDVGLPYVLRQLRRYYAEGRPLEDLLASWTRLGEYKYWEFRIGGELHFAASRAIAQQRIVEADRFMQALRTVVQGADVAAVG
jgi:hypothetical protein